MNIRSVAIIASWCLLVLIGLVVSMRYDTTPGASGAAPLSWNDVSGQIDPASDSSARQRTRAVMIAHPLCPCTRASLDELRAAIEEIRSEPRAGDFSMYVIFTVPGTFASDVDESEWTQSESVELARAIPGVSVIFDPRGRIASSCGAATSGYTLVFDASGALRFSGGVTPSRGARGDSAARRAFERSVTAPGERIDLPVFGCELVRSDELALSDGGDR